MYLLTVRKLKAKGTNKKGSENILKRKFIIYIVYLII